MKQVLSLMIWELAVILGFFSLSVPRGNARIMRKLWSSQAGERKGERAVVNPSSP
jgi:hypothetical protein